MALVGVVGAPDLCAGCCRATVRYVVFGARFRTFFSGVVSTNNISLKQGLHPRRRTAPWLEFEKGLNACASSRPP